MSLALYMDENVHRAITTGLRLRGVDVLTVQEDQRAGFADPLILNRATGLKVDEPVTSSANLQG